MPAKTVSPPLTELDKLRQPLTEGERLVLNFFLNHLTQDWEIYIQPHLNGLRPDFVLLSPQKGIAVFEVKDWNLDALHYFFKRPPNTAPILFGDDGKKQFSLQKNNPVERINQYKEEIFNLYCPRLEENKGFGVITAGIIFTCAKTQAVKELLRPAIQHYAHDQYERLNTVSGCDILNSSDITKVIPNVYKIDQRMSKVIAADLRNWLVEPEFSREQRIPLMAELDKKQRDLVTSRTSTGLRKIRGPAGCGKSLVIAGRAAKLSEDLKDVLVVTFNITMLNYLLDYAVRFSFNGKTRSQITALNFHYWCKRVALQTGHIIDYDELWKKNDNQKMMETLLATHTQEWLDELDEEDKYDAILVDEGQDFRREWWIALRKALRQGGEMVLVADKTQNIYGVSQSWTDGSLTGSGILARWNELTSSYRLPRSLCELASNFIDTYLPDTENMRPVPLQGEIDFHTELRWIQVQSNIIADICCNALIEIVKNAEPQIAFADLTCVVDHEEIGMKVVSLLLEKKIYCIHTFSEGGRESRRKKLAFFKGDGRVKVTTLHSFKGWESRALVVQVSKVDSLDKLSLLYTGITRLKKNENGSYLTVVCSAPELETFGRTWPYFSVVSSQQNLSSE